ncbi:MAG: hypothetical protein LQ342_008352 [Letrouitia transgressa]|nr:MAG: hypothetical protein LQ342_008352 [Letrouitia transgressa]
MRVSYFLAAALSLETSFAFPSFGLEPFKGRTLIARAPAGGSSRGGSRGHEHEEESYHGYRGSGTFHYDAPANSRHFVRRVVRRGEENIPRERYHVPITRDTPGPGDTAVHSEHFPDREPLHTAYFGPNTEDHMDGLLYREAAFPSSRTAEYRRASPGDRGNRRHETLRDLPRNRDLRDDSDSEEGPVDAAHEEKGPAGLQRDPVRWDGDYPALTVIQGSGTTSRRRDGPILNAAYRQQENEGGTVRIRANPPRDYSPGPVAPLRGPRVEGYPTPYHELTPESNYVRRRSDTPRRRSDSPRREGSGYTVRSTRDYRPRDDRDYYDYDRRYRSKRDVVEDVTEKQTHADSATKDDNKADDAKQEYQEYLQAYDAVRSNATNLIMPYIENMVNGSNSAAMWDAAWEIASLADPEIILVGGPFFYGMHAMDFYEDEAMNKTDNETMTSYFAIDEVLITQYQDTWNKCYKALNSSGLLHDLDVLQAALWTNDTALSQIEMDTSLTKDITDFFINGPNSTLAGDDGIDWSKVNSTAIGNSTMARTTNTTLASPREKIVPGRKKGTATEIDAETSTLAASATGTSAGTSTSAAAATASSKET